MYGFHYPFKDFPLWDKLQDPLYWEIIGAQALLLFLDLLLVIQAVLIWLILYPQVQRIFLKLSLKILCPLEVL